MSQKKAQLFNPLNGNINVTGVVTASSFVGSGSGLTGVASTDNIQTATDATFLANVNVTGVTTASAGFKGDITGVAATFTGNVSVGGTLTYQDVSSVDSVGLITARKGIQVLADGANITGVTTVGTALSLADNVKAKFGSSGDLQIFHDGANSIIQDVGTGDLRVAGNIVKINNFNNTATMLKATEGSSVELNHNNSKKFETTNTGAVVTGILTATSFSGNGSALTGISSWEVFDTWLYGGG